MGHGHGHEGLSVSSSEHGIRMSSVECGKALNLRSFPVLCVTCIQLAAARQFHSYDDFLVAERPSEVPPPTYTKEAYADSLARTSDGSVTPVRNNHPVNARGHAIQGCFTSRRRCCDVH